MFYSFIFQYNNRLEVKKHYEHINNDFNLSFKMIRYHQHNY